MLLEFRIGLPRSLERLVECYLFRRGDLLDCGGRIVRLEPVMGDFQRTGSSFSNQAIQGTTLEAGFGLSALVRNSSDDACLPEAIILGLSERSDEFPAICFRKEDTRAILRRSVYAQGS